ncbi:MAG: xanthine dehydrogenase family protein molybdopterin-binding subunit, partial [Spirochaetales bacterium]|nr:xanthine dehydrogenase family protein molybdopterin-binding subunit [Spirochaetales bacterium]
ALKKDHSEKCDGSLVYLADRCGEEALYGRLFRSTEAAGEIVSCTLPELPPDYYIIGAKDIGEKNFVKILAEDQRVFAENKVTYVGEPLFLIVGEDREKIGEIHDSIQVEYKKEEALLDFESRCDRHLSHMVSYQLGCSREESLALESQAYQVKIEEFKTPLQEHVYLEPQSVLAYVDREGRVTVEGSLQCPYYVKNAVMSLLGLPEEKVRVIQTPVGGAFGGKEDYPSLIACQVALATSLIGKPVKLIFDRKEDMMFTTKRHPSLVRYRTSLDKEGTILGMNIEAYIEGGANEGLSSVVLQRALINCIGVYEIPHVSAEGHVVFTNNVPNGAFRGFGAPQTIAALEAHMVHIARDFSLDPLEYKKRYLVKQGSRSVTGGLFRDPVLVDKMIEETKTRVDYDRKKAEFAEFNKGNGRYKKGLGASLFLHGCGFTGSGERDHIKAVVRLEKSEQDEVIIRIANVDMGQGLFTTMSKIVGEVLDMDYNRIRYPYPDTLHAPDSGPTVASRTIMIVGKILERAAQRLRDNWKSGEKQVFIEHYVHDDSALPWDGEKFTGDAYPAYSWGVNLAEVTVDRVTGHIDVDHVDASYDVGKAIDDRIIRGQIEGGLAQSLAYAYLENMENRNGTVQQRSLSDYGPPTSMDVPPMESFLYDNPYEKGPSGAKGAGELTFIGGAPAVHGAVEDALGVELSRLPLTPEYLLSVLDGAEEE